MFAGLGQGSPKDCTCAESDLMQDTEVYNIGLHGHLQSQMEKSTKDLSSAKDHRGPAKGLEPTAMPIGVRMRRQKDP